MSDCSWWSNYCLLKDAWNAGQHSTVVGVVLILLGALLLVAWCVQAWRNR